MVSLYKHHAPSNTSLSDDADDLDNEEDINQPDFFSNHQLVPAQWKHSRIVQRPAAVQSPISTIPQEILIQIFKHLHSSKDIYSALRVSRMWCQCAVELLWHKPPFPKYNTISKMAKILRKSDSTFTYARFIRRLNFLNHGPDFEDSAFSVFGRCDRLERLTLIGCKNLSGAVLAKILPMFSNLVAIDLTGVDNCTSDAIIGLASVASRLQGINISGCKQVTDPGIVALSQRCPLLRRVKLSGLVLITDVAISALATGCPMLLEIDLNGCKLITDVSVRLIWTNLLHMREMRLGHCDRLTDLAFPSPFRVDNEVNPFANAQREGDLPPLIINRSFDNLRMLDLTACALITDSAVEGLVSHAPKIRNLVLSKCVLLTDKAVEKICRLGRHLHYLHLGHASKISDASVRLLARSCTRIRYIDFANCVLLTDMSVFELSALPKLRRVGLVRVNQLTDEAIYSLGERHATLERIHLSYCDQISVMAIHFLLLKLHKLTHLSLTGVPSFRQPELQQFCREAPKDFNSTQRQAFCVFSGKGVSQLRAYLTELFDRITENNNTDDTEYEEEDEFDADGFQEDDTPEPEATFTASQMTEQGYPRREMLFNPQTAPPPQPMHLPHQPHEFNFQRERSHRPAPLPAPPAQYQPLNLPSATAHHLQGATNSLNAQIQASSANAVASSSRLPRTVRHGHTPGQGQGHGHGRTAADVLPIVESSQSSTADLPSAISPNHPGAYHDNGAGFFRSYQDRAAAGPSSRGHGVLTPDLNYAEIGHGRGAQNTESTSTLATVRPVPPFAGPRDRHPPRSHAHAHAHVSPAPEPPHSGGSSRANSADNSENDMSMRRPVFTQPGMPSHWPYQEANHVASAQELTASVQQALGGSNTRGDPRQRGQFGQSAEALPSGSEQRGHGVRRNLRNTLHAAENYASNFLFGRGGAPGDSSHGGSSSSRPR